VFVNGQPLACKPGWLDRVTSFIARQAVWQVHRLQRLGKPVIFVLDEPTISLALAGASAARASTMVAAINRVFVAVHEAGAVAGLHCCAPLPLALIQACNADLVSFDAHLPMDGGQWFDLARAVIARSGYLAFGLVPTDPNSRSGAPDEFTKWFGLSAAAGDVIEIANRTIVTATCGLAFVTPAHAACVFERCRQLGDRIAQLARSGSL
jgi:hypothetical protein